MINIVSVIAGVKAAVGSAPIALVFLLTMIFTVSLPNQSFTEPDDRE